MGQFFEYLYARIKLKQFKDELIADWELAIKGEAIFKIDPLK
jgi:hypothetical protein